MFAITGITGQVGGEVARNLLAGRQTVRGVVRDVNKAKVWAERGCELMAADVNDAAALTAAFEGVDGVFVLVPTNFDPSPDFQEARAIAGTLNRALDSARPRGVVYLSTIGAQTTHLNLLSQHTIIEQALRKVSVPITCLIQSFLQPLDKPIPMVATADIGCLAAELLQEKWKGHRVVELEGPRPVTPKEIAATFARLLGRPVRVEAVPRETWGPLFKSQGMKNPEPRVQMLDGFNEGWIKFEGKDGGVRKGKVEASSTNCSSPKTQRDTAIRLMSQSTSGEIRPISLRTQV